MSDEPSPGTGCGRHRESVSTVNPFAIHKTDNPDGSVTAAFTGLVFAITAPGPPYVDSGRG